MRFAGRDERTFFTSSTSVLRFDRLSGVLARILSQWMDRAGPLLIGQACKQLVNRVLAFLAKAVARKDETQQGVL